MNCKRPSAATAIVLLLFLPLPSHALFYIGGGEVVLGANVGLEYDSNVFSNAAEESDFVARAGVNLNYARPFRHFRIGAGAGISTTQYDKFSDRSRTNWTFSFLLEPTADFGTRTWTLDTDLSFQRRTRSEEDLGNIVTTDNYRAGLTLTIHPQPRYYFQISPAYTLTKPRDFDRDDRETYRLAFLAGYVLSPRYNLFASASRNETKTDNPNRIESVVWSYMGGIRGRFTPKLNGSASAGFSRRKLDLTGETKTTPTFSVGLNYRIDETTSASLTASRQFASSLADFNQTVTTATLSFNRTLRHDLTGSLGFSVTERSFERAEIDRRDRAYSASVDLNYRVAEWGTLSGGISHTIQDSGQAAFDYSRTRVYVRLSGRF